MDRSRVAAVIPAYNEAATIAAVVAAAVEFVDVIVVDDCSSDQTAALARGAGARVLGNSQNAGYDVSLSRGISFAMEAGYCYVVTMDADGEHNPACLEQFREALVNQGVPLVLGVRERKQRWSEVVMGWYVRARFGVTDILCGMKGYDVSLVKTNDGFDRGHSAGTELAINSLRRGCSFVEIAVSGERRRDAPRFGSLLRANAKILRALSRAIGDDIAHVFKKATQQAA